MRSKSLALAITFSALLLTAFIAEGAIPTAERAALIALYNSTNGAGWIDRTNWRNPSDTDFNDPGTECTWTRVWCGPSGTTVRRLYFSSNQLSGSIPVELGNLANLEYLYLNSNDLSGSIPWHLGNLSIVWLDLSSNQLSGSIPWKLSYATNLTRLDLSSNQLCGSIPVELADLTHLSSNYTDFGHNALWTEDYWLRVFLDRVDPDWDQTQTIAPEDPAASLPTSSSVVLNWIPIIYTDDDGAYAVFVDPPPGEVVFGDDFESGGTSWWGVGEPWVMTVDKTDNSILVDGLAPDTTYEFVIRTITEPHPSNQNQVVSDPSVTVSETTEP